jgi:hypothetical protein
MTCETPSKQRMHMQPTAILRAEFPATCWHELQDFFTCLHFLLHKKNRLCFPGYHSGSHRRFESFSLAARSDTQPFSPHQRSG